MSELNRKETGMKIISAELKNFQSLSSKVIDIQGKSIVVVGKNGGSKSTVLRAIQSPINSEAVPSKAIKKGEESAHVKLVIKGDLDGEQKTFQYIMNFTESNQKGSVTVVDEEGNKIKTKSMQRDIIGDVSFDVDEFIRLGLTSSGKVSQAGLKEQVEVLRQFLTDDEKQLLEDLDNENKEKRDERTELNRTIKTLKANLSSATDIKEEDVKKYTEDKSKELTEVNNKLLNMVDGVVKYNKARTALTEHQTGILEGDKSRELTKYYRIVLDKAKALGEDNERFLLDLKNRMHDHDLIQVRGKASAEQIVKVKAWIEKNEEPDVDKLRDKQTELVQYTAMYTKIQDVVTKHAEVTKQEAKANKLTKRLKAIVLEKQKSFETSTLPVKGLSFDEEGVYFEGLPFNGDHHPSSVIIRVGVQLAIAMNPNLKCIFIKDGSLFDKETFSKVLKFIEKKGYQLFIEMVDWNANGDAEVRFAEAFINN